MDRVEGSLSATKVGRGLLTAPGDQVPALNATILLALFMARGQVGEVPLFRGGTLALPRAAAAAAAELGGGRGAAERVAGGGVDAGVVRFHRGGLAQLVGRLSGAAHLGGIAVAITIAIAVAVVVVVVGKSCTFARSKGLFLFLQPEY